MEKMDNSGIELSPKEYAELSCSSMEITLYSNSWKPCRNGNQCHK